MESGIDLRCKMFRSIKTKFTFIVFGILLFMVAIQLVCNYFLVEPFYVEKKSNVIKEAYEELKDSSGKTEEIMSIMKHYEESHNLQFLLANENLVCIYNSRQEDFRIWKNKYRVRSDFSFRKNINRFSQKPEVVVMSQKENRKRNDKVALFGILQFEKEDYYVVVKSNVKSIQEAIKETSELILFFNVIGLIVGGVIAYFFGKKMTEPILEMDEVACHVANLDFTKQVKEKEGIQEDELSRLAKNINEMSKKIEENIIKLQEENLLRKRMEEARKEFIANVSHELKTPLAILNGYAQMLLMAGENIDKGYYCEVILDETKKMTELVNQLLELAKMEKEAGCIPMEPVNITALVKEQMEKRIPLLEKSHIQVEFYAEENCYVEGNKEYLEVIFNNYMANAMTHIQGERILKVELKKEKKDEVTLSVFNTGEPIPDEKITKIWDSFYQAEESHKRMEGEKRVGLGLYIVSMLANAHKGSCCVFNKENGVLFTFSMKTMEENGKKL